MFNKLFQTRNFFLAAIFTVSLTSGCAVEAAKEKVESDKQNAQTQAPALSESKSQPSKASIKIEPNSPADTVRVFYKGLRERKFREAMFLTNLRPAIEGLTDAELKELQVDFEPLAAQVPAEIEINGEIISENKATVTAKLPDVDTEKLGVQEIKLRRDNGVWVILTVEEAVETEVKKEGKNYFFALRIKTHHEEAKAMMERIHKAQMVYAVQNAGHYADIPTLTAKGFLPQDVTTSDSTGYNYQIQLSADKMKYTAIAVPAVYGKTGKMTFQFVADGNKISSLKSQDNKGQAFKM
jgi:hypothetical protein